MPVQPSPANLHVLRVGHENADVIGNDHRALQAAVDDLAKLGGGRLEIGPGRYLMRNALKLASGIHIQGVPGKTILFVENSFQSPLRLDGDCNERQVTPVDASGFEIGDGVMIRDERFGSGFCVTTATLTARTAPDSFALSQPLYLDYMVPFNASITRAFPVIGGWGVRDVLVEGITIEGNRGNNHLLNGCRGGGIYLFECERAVFRNCVVRNYNGDGISFQVSNHITIEDCVVENNSELGLHPGSGAQYPILRRNRSINNGGVGLFVCWRVKHGIFEKNEIVGNGRQGISIGHKDTDNVFRDNLISNNAQCGVLFREESEPMGAHRNTFERNQILDNGPEAPQLPLAAVVIHGHTNDIVFRENKIGFSKASGGHAFYVEPNVCRFMVERNQYLRVNEKYAPSAPMLL